MKIIRTITTAMLSLLALAACNNEEILPDGTPDSDGNKIRITTTVGNFTSEDGAPGTRASINDDTGVGTFENNDKIGLWVMLTQGSTAPETMQTLTYNGGGSWSGCTTVWENYEAAMSADSKLRFAALYPAPQAGGNETSFTVETNQSSPEDYEASDLLFAISEFAAKPQDGIVKLAFEHKMACLKITLNGDDAANASVVVKDVETKCVVNIDGSITTSTGNKADITPKKTDGSNAFYTLIPPQTLTDGLKLDITVDEKTTTHTVTGTNGKALEGGSQYNIALTLK